jgi:hypothetical protein
MTRRIRERGRGGWLGLSPGRFCKKREKKKRKKKRKKKKKGQFGQNSFEFRKFKNTKKGVVMVCSNGFYDWYKPSCKFSEFLNKCKRDFGEVLIME